MLVKQGRVSFSKQPPLYFYLCPISKDGRLQWLFWFFTHYLYV